MDDSNFFAAVQTLAQSISQWDLLIIAGSMVIILSTGYYRPDPRWVRAAYLLFLPAWIFLALSIYRGVAVQGSYVAYLVAARKNNSALINQIAMDVNNDSISQINFLKLALLFLALWLVIYMIWWIFFAKPQRTGGTDQ